MIRPLIMIIRLAVTRGVTISLGLLLVVLAKPKHTLDSRTSKRARGSKPLPPQADGKSDFDEEMQGDGQPADATATYSEDPIENGGGFELADDMFL
jgi:hypothetical protein